MCNDSQDGNEFLTASELAQRFRVAERTVWRWKDQGLIPYVQPSGPRGTVRFPSDCLRPISTSRLGPASDVVRIPGQGTRKLSGRLPKWEVQSANNTTPKKCE